MVWVPRRSLTSTHLQRNMDCSFISYVLIEVDFDEMAGTAEFGTMHHYSSLVTNSEAYVLQYFR